MKAQIDLGIKPIGLKKTQEEIKEEVKKSERWFLKLNKFIRRSVNYYADEKFRKNGGPLRWID